jgi:hypothetical protein
VLLGAEKSIKLSVELVFLARPRTPGPELLMASRLLPDFLTILGRFCWTGFGDGGDVVAWPNAPNRFSLKEWALDANLPFMAPLLISLLSMFGVLLKKLLIQNFTTI